LSPRAHNAHSLQFGITEPVIAFNNKNGAAKNPNFGSPSYEKFGLQDISPEIRPI
jgi:hypothetical protein